MSRSIVCPAVIAAVAAVASAQGVTGTVSPRPALVATPLSHQFCNQTGSGIFLPSSAPWTILDLAGNPIYAPFSLPVITPLAHAQCLTFSWNGRDAAGNPVPAGLYQWEVRWLDGQMNPQPPLRTCFEITDAAVIPCGNATVVPVGCPIQLTFSAPSSPVTQYFAASALGSSPGIPVEWCREVPLTFDGLFLVSLCSSGPVFTGYCGILDNLGRAPAQINTPLDLRLIGFRFETSFVTITWGSGRVYAIAAARTFTLGPPSPPCIVCR